MRVGTRGCRCHPPPPAAGPAGGTHPQKTSMASSAARRMAKRMERMVVMATMPALCPLPVEMLLAGSAGERAGGEGAGRRDTHPGVAQGSGWVTACSRVPSQCAITRCHRTRVRPAAEPYLSFPSCSQEPSPQITVAQHSAPWDHPTRPRPPHIPPDGSGLGVGAGWAPVPVLSMIGIDQFVSATGTESARARNFTLRWEGRLATVP